MISRLGSPKDAESGKKRIRRIESDEMRILVNGNLFRMESFNLEKFKLRLCMGHIVLSFNLHRTYELYTVYSRYYYISIRLEMKLGEFSLEAELWIHQVAGLDFLFFIKKKVEEAL